MYPRPPHALTGVPTRDSFCPCAVCSFPRHGAQYADPQATVCQFCESPDRFPLAEPHPKVRPLPAYWSETLNTFVTIPED